MPEFPPDKLRRGFIFYVKTVYKDEPMPDAKLEQLRNIYMVGAATMFEAMNEASGHPNEDVCEARLKLVVKELMDFTAQMQREKALRDKAN